VRDSHTVGTEANRQLQIQALKVFQTPWHVPKHIHPSKGPRKGKGGEAAGNPVEGISEEERQKLTQALRLVSEGEKGKAMQVLCSLGLALVDEDTMRLTRAMFNDDPEHPPEGAAFAPHVPQRQPSQQGVAAPESHSQAPPPTYPSVAISGTQAAELPPPVPSQPSQSQAADPPADSMWSRKSLGQFLSQKLHVAADFLGWDGGTMLFLVQKLNAKAYAGFVDLLQLVLEGAVDSPELLAVLRRSRGHLLNKSPGAVRAIGVVSWWMQVPSALQIRVSKDTIISKLGKENVAVGVPGGSEALARAVQLALEEHPIVGRVGHGLYRRLPLNFPLQSPRSR